jgi:hypothetical protein
VIAEAVCVGAFAPPVKNCSVNQGILPVGSARAAQGHMTIAQANPSFTSDVGCWQKIFLMSRVGLFLLNFLCFLHTNLTPYYAT